MWVYFFAILRDCWGNNLQDISTLKETLNSLQQSVKTMQKTLSKMQRARAEKPQKQWCLKKSLMHVQIFLIRVVHSNHSWAIFDSFLTSFWFHFSRKWNWEWNEKGRENDHLIKPYPSFCKKWSEKCSFFTFLALFLTCKMHFHFIFLNFRSQGVHSRHFSHYFSFHFQFPFVCFSAKYLKMSEEWDWKWAEKWPKNGHCEQPYYHPLYAIWFSVHTQQKVHKWSFYDPAFKPPCLNIYKSLH